MAESGGHDAAADTRYTLTEEENEWCIDLENALKSQKIPCPPTDFQLAQFALVGKGDTKKAIKRVQKYNETCVSQWGYISATATPQGCIGQMNTLCPGFGINFVPPQSDGHCCVHTNYSLFLPDALKTDDDFKKCIHEVCMVFDCLNHDLDRVRAGSVFIINAADIGWSNMSMDFNSKISAVYQDAYPAKFHQFPIVESGMLMTASIKLMQLWHINYKTKLSDRIVFTTYDGLIEDLGYDRAALPAPLGTFVPDDVERASEYQAKRKVTIAKVKINRVGEVGSRYNFDDEGDGGGVAKVPAP